MNIQSDILSLSISPLDGLPKAKYNISDTTLNKLIKIENNDSLQNSIKEHKVVMQALQLVDDISKKIFEIEFRQTHTKWYAINELNISERTYERKKQSLIYCVHKELKNWRKIGGIFIKNRVIILMCRKRYKLLRAKLKTVWLYFYEKKENK